MHVKKSFEIHTPILLVDIARLIEARGLEHRDVLGIEGAC